MENNSLIINKDTKKLFRLQTSEKYITKRISTEDFEVFTQDLKLKACVSTMGTLFLSNGEDYSKKEFYKLKNFCTLLCRCHFKI